MDQSLSERHEVELIAEKNAVQPEPSELKTSILKCGSGRVLPDFFDPTARIQAIKKDLVASDYSICFERSLLLEDFRRSRAFSKNDHQILKRAKSLAYVFRHRKPSIYEGELIAGNLSSKRTAANYYIESASSGVVEDVFRLRKRPVPIVLTLREKLTLLRLVLKHSSSSIPGRTFFHFGRFSSLFTCVLNPKRFIVTELAGVSHQVPDYRLIVEKGLKHVDDTAKKYLEDNKNAKGETLSIEQAAFYEGTRIVIAGIKDMAANLAKEALRLAGESGASAQRRSELRSIAHACLRVPYKPSRTLQEGLQACWIMHICMNLEDFEQGISFGGSIRFFTAFI